MSQKPVTVSLSDEQIEAVKAYGAGKKFSTAVSELINLALNGKTVETAGSLQVTNVIIRLEALENDVKELKIKTMIHDAKINPVKKKGGLRHGFVEITDEVRVQMCERFDLMRNIGMNQVAIASILGFKSDTAVSNIRSGDRKSISQKGYDALMAWTP